jgi:glycosyltransferase involved in cell wall biosynthesis
MDLDVVIPTYNRAHLLGKTLDSLFRVVPPSDLRVAIHVVNNNSRDNTEQVIRRYAVHYIFEQKPGRSNALNAGITQSSGDLIAMIDDDEEISPSWYAKIAAAFREPALDFIGGPYEPKFEVPPPKWLTGNLRGAVGWMDFGPNPRAYGSNFNGLLLGGNVVIRRAMLARVGLYNTSIGRTGKRLMIGEDDDMYERLLRAGARGMYFPDLVVYHWIPATRLSKNYIRKWTFWAGVSESIREQASQSNVPRILGVPRYRLGRLIRAPLNVLLEPATIFKQELTFWWIAGFVYGSNCYEGSHPASRDK